jgi:carboxypeptidase-like protein/TonB-dependent receptor-like protein
MRLFAIILALSCIFTNVIAQKKAAYVSGKVVDENENPLAGVSVIILGKTTGVTTNDSGSFRIKTPAAEAFALIFSYTGYRESQRNFYLNKDEEEHITVRLTKNTSVLPTVVLSNDRDRKETGLTKINPKDALSIPTVSGGIEGLIKTQVGSNNELTSQYTVRGGNFDENLVYINDFEVFRPYLVNSGQQEGLSIINPELARNVSFYNGGFQAKYGDKMSSVLDIQYKKPSSFGGSAYASLLEQGFHLEGTSNNQRFTYLFGARNKTNSDLLSGQETQGVYVPSSSDVQTFLTYKLSTKWQLELLGILSATKFSFIPHVATLTSSVFSPLFTEDLALNVFFNGQEKDVYSTNLIGFSAINQVNKKLKLKWMLSRFEDNEKQNYDIGGTYLFGDRDFDPSSSTYGQIINPLGAGYYQNYTRDNLNIDVWNAGVKGFLDEGKHYIQWGTNVEQNNIAYKIYEWNFQDSAGYSIPQNGNNLSSFVNSTGTISFQKISGYAQDNINLSHDSKDISLQAGLRYNYNTLNNEFFVTPRMQFSIKPQWKKDIVLKFSAGTYYQPPFFRELFTYNDSLNTNVKAQKSLQFVAGMDYNFKSNSNHAFRLTTEAYYKNMWDVNPYDIVNTQIKYFGKNDATAYAYGIETRLYTELVKDAESWVSLGLMHTEENISDAYYPTYKNAEGEIINANSKDKVPTDTVQTKLGWVRRPTDRLITLGIFLQDYLSTNKNIRVHLNTIYGTNLPYNIPNDFQYRGKVVIDPYIRVDIGFSAMLLSETSERRSHSPFRGFKNIWASLEVLNLIDRANVISYQSIKDFSNTTYLIPNTLTPRMLNVKIVARF